MCTTAVDFRPAVLGARSDSCSGSHLKSPVGPGSWSVRSIPTRQGAEREQSSSRELGGTSQPKIPTSLQDGMPGLRASAASATAPDAPFGDAATGGGEAPGEQEAPHAIASEPNDRPCPCFTAILPVAAARSDANRGS